MRRTWTGVVCLAVLTAGCGDGPKTGTVSGTVTVSGKPLADGTVTFALKAGGATPVTAAVTGGRYTATGVPYGELSIGVQPPPPADTVSTAKPENPSAPPPPPSAPPAWAKRYGDPLTSGLGLTLDAPTKDHNIDIK